MRRRSFGQNCAKQLGGLKFYRQFGAGRYILDFYCPVCRLAIELDGGQHGEAEKILYDGKRTEYLNKNNIRVIRFWDNDVLKNIEGVLLNILKNLTPPRLASQAKRASLPLIRLRRLADGGKGRSKYGLH